MSALPVNRRAGVLAFLGLVLVLSVLFSEALFSSKGLLPVDGIYRFAPWIRTEAAASVEVQNPLMVDQYCIQTPLDHLIRSELGAGRIPLWNPYILCGAPNLASGQTAAFHPVHLLVSLLDPFAGAEWAAFLKLLLSGLFTWMYLRQLGLRAPASWLGALIASLGAYWVLWIGRPNLNIAPTLPALLYFLDRAMSRPGRARRAWVGFGLTFGVALLGGHPPSVVHVALLVGAYFLFRTWIPLRPEGEGPPRERPAFGRAVVAFGLALVLGVMFSAIQLLPYFEYVFESSTLDAAGELERWKQHLSPGSLFGFLTPHLGGNPARGGEAYGSLLGLQPHELFPERTGYVGVLTLALALCALVRKDAAVRFWALVVAFSFLIVFGIPPVHSLFGRLPILDASNNQRLLFFIGFGLACLAAFALDGLERGQRARPMRIAAGVVTLGLLVFTIWLAFWFGGDASHLWKQLGFVIAAVPVLAVVFFVLRPGPLQSALCLGFCALDLIAFGYGYNPAVAREHYYPKTPALEFLAEDESVYRVFGLFSILPTNSAVMFGLQDARGWDCATVRNYEELIHGRVGDFAFYGTAPGLPDALPLLDVAYVLAPPEMAPSSDAFELAYSGEIAIYKNRERIGRAFAVESHEVLSRAALLERVRRRDFDPTEQVLFEREPAAQAAASGSGSSAMHVEVTGYENESVTLEAELEQAGWVVLLDTHFPGWEATVNGERVPIERAYGNFRAVPAPAGRSTIEYRYRPLSFRIGWILSALSLGLAGLLLARRQA